MSDQRADAHERVTDYDRIADRFDARYARYSYDGVRETLLAFVGEAPVDVLEVGCGTGHWLAALLARRPPSDDRRAAVEPGDARGATTSAARPLLAGVDPSAPMLAFARAAAPGVHLVQARAENLPWPDASFDRIFCVNALHHFTDRARFFAEARRLLRPGGGLLTVGLDPHSERDTWWVYDYFEGTLAIDRARFAQVRTLRGDITRAGFAWAESIEADQIESIQPAAAALAGGPGGPLDRGFTSQLTVLSDEEYRQGLDRIRVANDAANGGLQLVTDLRLYATTGWLA
jgi:SAM-dependent methyltransferase